MAFRTSPLPLTGCACACPVNSDEEARGYKNVTVAGGDASGRTVGSGGIVVTVLLRPPTFDGVPVSQLSNPPSAIPAPVRRCL